MLATFPRPLKSCLNPSHPIVKDLKRLLNLLVLVNKYDANEIEDYLIALVEPLTQPSPMETHLNKGLSASDVLRIANRVGRPSIAQSAQTVILDQLWGKNALTSPYETLVFGEELGDKAIIGASYYQILLHGEGNWSTADLTDIHRRNLTVGRLKCGEEWQKIFDSVAGAGDHPIVNSMDWKDDYYSRPSARIVNLWRSLGQSHLPWYDLMGKIEILMGISSRDEDGCRDEAAICRAEAEVNKMKDDLHLYFKVDQIQGARTPTPTEAGGAALSAAKASKRSKKKKKS